MHDRMLPYIVRETSKSTDLDSTLDATIRSINEYGGFECIGIRIKDNEDYPYRKTLGFTKSFIKKENSLLSKNENGDIIHDANGKAFSECMCGNVIQGRFDSSLPFFTKKGSFWTNSTTNFLASTIEKERQTHTRNYCNSVGFESVGIFPLKVSLGINIGALHITDKRQGMFTDQNVETFELIAFYIANQTYKYISIIDEMHKEINELKQMNEFMKDREYRIIELKDDVGKLKKRLGEELN